MVVLGQYGAILVVLGGTGSAEGGNVAAKNIQGLGNSMTTYCDCSRKLEYLEQS